MNTNKENSESRIPTTKNNTNKKKMAEEQGRGPKPDLSILKKNEFAMILGGAMVLTLIVFFFFFRSSDPAVPPADSTPSVSSANDLEIRIEKLEQAFQDAGSAAGGEPGSEQTQASDTRLLEERIARLETAFSVKMDSMVERLGNLEKNVSHLMTKPVSAPRQAETKPKPAAPSPEKKTVKKESIFHTVQKGETLFSISRKYNTSVATLRKLNNLSEKSVIHPGNNLLIR